MHTDRYWLAPKDCRRLLAAVMQYFAGDGVFLSLEGSLPDRLKAFRPQVDVATLPAFKRQCQHPILDFIAIPLNTLTLPRVERELAEDALVVGWEAAVNHLQIGEPDRLCFGAYDGFHEEC